MNVRQHWRALILCGALLVSLALARLVRDAPLQLSFLRIDSLAVFFAFATLAALTLAATPVRVSRCAWLAAALLLVAYTVTLTPVIAALCAVAALVAGGGTNQGTHGPVSQDTQASVVGGRWSLVSAARHALGVAAPLIAAASLLVSYGTLALSGALHYDDRAAGAALNSLTFWFVLLPVHDRCHTTR